jgi:hypothetical protein
VSQVSLYTLYLPTAEMLGGDERDRWDGC